MGLLGHIGIGIRIALKPRIDATIAAVRWGEERTMAPKVAVDREKLIEICKKHHIRKLALFGSVLRDDFGPESDVDILVEFEPDGVPGFFGLHRIEREIAAIFGGRRIDLLTFRSLNPHLRDRILAEAEIQYAA